MRWKASGVITVFFSLLSLIFIGLFFVLVESVRYEGARAQAAGATELGNFSVFGEYEQMLLSEFDLFGLDGARGTGSFSVGRINELLRQDLLEDVQIPFCYEPWHLSLEDCRIRKYALLTDKGGDYFYGQAVRYMRNTAITGSITRLMRFYREAKDADKKQEAYKKQQTASDGAMKDLEGAEKEAESEQQENAKKTPKENAKLKEQKKDREKKNPLKTLIKLARQDLLKTVCPGAKISGGKVRPGKLFSHRAVQKGNLKLKAERKGLINDLLFREYLLEHFGNYRNHRDGDGLLYEIEYILNGKNTDRDNLRATASKLLLLREGCNYASCSSDGEMCLEVEGLAALLIGWTGIPALVSVMKQALLIGWSFGESVLDVKTLMDGGCVPVTKTADTWELSLDNLKKINDFLKEDRSGKKDGLPYLDHLRLLLNLQSVSAQQKRGIDMIELRVQGGIGLADFKADHCIIAIQDEVTWKIPPLFSRVTGALLYLAPGQNMRYELSSGYTYLA